MNSDDLELEPFDPLAALARFGLEHRISLNDPQVVPKFATLAGNALKSALSERNRLHGKRAEAMFEALLVSLGGYSLLKAEDTGRVYPKGRFKAPDFRIVLLDGTQWLIEVKNVYEEDPFQQSRLLMKRAYREKLENYALATGGQLKLAVYWAKWRLWTLVTPEPLVDADGNLTLDMETAVRANELSSLGDLMIGTRPPLRFRLEADPDKASSMAPDGMARFTISGVRMYCGEDEILDPVEKHIAWIFMLYGGWEEIGPEPLLDGVQLTGIEFRWQPQEQANKSFEIIGTLSEMFSRYYAEQTIENDEVVQIRAPLRPGLFVPLANPDYKSKVLPLCRLRIQAGKTGETDSCSKSQ